jgi:hypothetical protein
MLTGAFGLVQKGELIQEEGTSIEVAIKAMKGTMINGLS